MSLMYVKQDDLELVLGLAMYRIELQDANAHSDEWPVGMTSNIGELDSLAEFLIRQRWAGLTPDESHAIRKMVAEQIRERAKLK